jgi:hypothetical protein
MHFWPCAASLAAAGQDAGTCTGGPDACAGPCSSPLLPDPPCPHRSAYACTEARPAQAPAPRAVLKITPLAPVAAPQGVSLSHNCATAKLPGPHASCRPGCSSHTSASPAAAAGWPAGSCNNTSGVWTMQPFIPLLLLPLFVAALLCQAHLMVAVSCAWW